MSPLDLFGGDTVTLQRVHLAWHRTRPLEVNAADCPGINSGVQVVGAGQRHGTTPEGEAATWPRGLFPQQESGKS